jgi:hypothetical protein
MTITKIFKYEFLFKSIGYNSNRNQDYEESLDIESNSEYIIPIPSKKNISKNNWCYFYNVLILLLISWKIFYILWSAIYHKDINYGGLVSFPILVTSEYCIGIWYFNQSYFHEKMKRKNMRDRYNKYLIISSLISMLLTLTSIILLWFNIDMYSYSEIFINTTYSSKSGITILMFFDLLYSHQILAINFSAFIGNLLYIQGIILTMKEDITNGINSSISTKIKINKIAGGYKNSKGQFEKNVSETEPIFEIFNILTMIHLGFLANMFSNNNIYIIHIIYAVLYIIIYVIFLYIINTVNKVTGDIDSLIKENLFLDNFFQNINLGKPKLIKNKNITNDNFIEEINIVINSISNKLLEIDQKTCWKILRDEVKEDWAKYTILGFIEVDGASIITKLLAVIVTIFMGTILISSKDNNQLEHLDNSTIKCDDINIVELFTI